MNNIKNPFAVDSRVGELIHISDYLENKDNYLLTNLYCPECKGMLIPKALESDRMVSHFAHLNLDLCHGYETALHEWSKNVFKSLIGREIILPSLNELVTSKQQINDIYKFLDKSFTKYRFENEKRIRTSGFVTGWYLKNYFESSITKTKEWIKQQITNFNNTTSKRPTIKIENVEVEFKLKDQVICDVWINNEYNIEIYVTHSIGELKEVILNENKIKTIEIDLSKIDSSVFEKTKIINVLLNDVTRKKIVGIKNFEFYNRVDLNTLKDEIQDKLLQEVISKLENEISNNELTYNQTKIEIAKHKDNIIAFLEQRLYIIERNEIDDILTDIDWRYRKALYDQWKPLIEKTEFIKIIKVGEFTKFEPRKFGCTITLIFPNHLELGEHSFVIKISKNNYNELINVTDDSIHLKSLSYKYKIKFLKYIREEREFLNE